MKTRALVIAGIIALTVMASTRVAQAQQQMVVNIPFDFVAGTNSLPAGEYTVQVSGAAHTLILMDRQDATASALMNTYAVDSSKPQADSKLIFHRYGDRYFLSQVWSEGDSRGRELSKSDREKEMALTAKIETTGQVTLVASLLPTNR
jgi:hypothetical protein